MGDTIINQPLINARQIFAY